MRDQVQASGKAPTESASTKRRRKSTFGALKGSIKITGDIISPVDVQWEVLGDNPDPAGLYGNEYPIERPVMSHFTLIAHRGFSSDAPENTVDAFDLALEYGFDNFELDAQLSSDGVPVVIHDDLLDRTTTGKGRVSQTPIAKIKSLDAGLWFEGPPDTVGRKGPAMYGESFVPTLDEVLTRYAGRAHIHLELKSREQELAPKAAELLKAHGWVRGDATPSRRVGGKRSVKATGAGGVIISSFLVEQLHRSKRLLPDTPHGWLIERIEEPDIELAVKLGLDGIYPRAGSVTREAVSRAQEAGLTVRTWGVRTLEDLDRAVASGAAGTTVDWPLRAQKHLAAR